MLRPSCICKPLPRLSRPSSNLAALFSLSPLSTSSTIHRQYKPSSPSWTQKAHLSTTFPLHDYQPKMKEVKVFKSDKESDSSLRAELHDSPVPTPQPNQVLIKVVVAGTNPKDWKYVAFSPKPAPGPGLNTGDDIAGLVHAVGSDVTEFKVGDRVAAFHVMRSPGGAFAEYAVAPATTTFHIPAKTSFEEAATIPLAAMTAVVGLYARLGLPEPWAKVHPSRAVAAQGGVVVYGAASAVGAFAVKLLVRADVHPLICVAGRGIPYVESLIDKSKGDSVIDYRTGDDAVVQGIKAAVPQGGKLTYAFDAVSEHNSVPNICRVLDEEGHITTVLPGVEYPEIKPSTHKTLTTVGSVHKVPDDLEDLGYAWFRLFGLGLQEGWFSGHPYEIVEGGLEGVIQGLRWLKEGKASAVKYVYRVEDTPKGGSRL